MAVRKAMRKQRSAKTRIAVTVSTEILDWIESNKGPDKRFGSVSHAVETALVRLRDGR